MFYNQATTRRTIRMLLLIQYRSFLSDFRGLFFVFGFPLILTLLIGLIFFQPDQPNSKYPYLLFGGLTLIGSLTINVSVVAFNIVDWRKSVLFSRIKVANIHWRHLLIAFLGFYNLLTALSWLWTFAIICLIILTRSDAGHVASFIQKIRWDWQLLAIIASIATSLPIGIALGFGLKSVEAVQFAGSLVLTTILSLGGLMFPIGLITQHSKVLRGISYLIFFQYVVKLNQIAWNSGHIPDGSVYNDGYQMWVLLVAVVVFTIGFWLVAAGVVVKDYRQK